MLLNFLKRTLPFIVAAFFSMLGIVRLVMIYTLYNICTGRICLYDTNTVNPCTDKGSMQYAATPLLWRGVGGEVLIFKFLVYADKRKISKTGNPTVIQ
jgi:hypothetical protein